MRKLHHDLAAARDHLLGAMLLTVVLLLSSTSAFAIPFAPIAPDLAISGSVNLSRADSDGNLTQQGEIRKTEGGTTTSSMFSTSPGVNNTTGPATNPLTGTLTDIDDGFGAETDLDGLFELNDHQFLFDVVLDLANNSVGDTYKVTIKVNHNSQVDADGDDAFASLQLEAALDTVDQVQTEIISDTLFEDEKNGVFLGTFGDTVSDIAMSTFDVTLTAGATRQVTAFWNLEGLVFEDPGASNIDGFFDITIADVMCVSGPGCTTQPPPPIPEPGTSLLLGLGLLPLATVTWRRRIRRKRANN